MLGIASSVLSQDIVQEELYGDRKYDMFVQWNLYLSEVSLKN